MYKNHSPYCRAKADQAAYESNRRNSCRTYDFIAKSKFINYVSDHFFNDNWLLNTCYGRAITDRKFTRKEMVCVKVLYNYVDAGLIGIKNHHHSKKLSKKSKQNRAKVNKNSLPRKLLGYKTVDELFEEELDKIYQVDAA